MPDALLPPLLPSGRIQPRLSIHPPAPPPCLVPPPAVGRWRAGARARRERDGRRAPQQLMLLRSQPQPRAASSSGTRDTRAPLRLRATAPARQPATCARQPATTPDSNSSSRPPQPPPSPLALCSLLTLPPPPPRIAPALPRALRPRSVAAAVRHAALRAAAGVPSNLLPDQRAVLA
jgi:hypothetical protein